MIPEYFPGLNFLFCRLPFVLVLFSTLGVFAFGFGSIISLPFTDIVASLAVFFAFLVGEDTPFFCLISFYSSLVKFLCGLIRIYTFLFFFSNRYFLTCHFSRVFLLNSSLSLFCSISIH